MTLFYDTNNAKLDLNSMFYDGRNLVGTDTRIMVVNKDVDLDIPANSLLTSTKIPAKRRFYQASDGIITIGGEDFLVNKDHKWIGYERILLSKPQKGWFKTDASLIEAMYAVASKAKFCFDFVGWATKLKKLEKQSENITKVGWMKEGPAQFENKKVILTMMPLINYGELLNG